MKVKFLSNLIKNLQHPRTKTTFSLLDMLFLLFFSFLGLFSRTFRISYPPNRCFDETHFGRFTNSYIKRTYFHDIHPPLGKLLLAFVGYLTNYNGEIDFSGDEYNDLHYVSLRSVPSTFSALIPPASFLAMRIFGYSIFASILVSSFLAYESMLIVESHLILIDGFLHSFTALTILSISIFESKPNSKTAIIFVSMMAGCTFSIKYTGLSVLVFVAAQQFLYFSKSSLTYLFKMNSNANKTQNNSQGKIKRLFYRIKETLSKIITIPFVRLIGRMLLIIFLSFSVMIITFIIHIIILEYSGKGESFMPRNFRRTLISPGSSEFGSRTCCMPMWKRVITLIRVMHRSNMNIKAGHSASSKWYDWPLARMKSIPYYTKKYSLVLFPTPLIWYTAAIGPLICVALAAAGYFLGNEGLTKLIIWPAGYYASWIPFCLIPRVLFVYHYLVPLIFGCFSFAASLDVLLSLAKKWRPLIFVLFWVAATASYIFFAPWMYAMSGYDWKSRMWKKNMF